MEDKTYSFKELLVEKPPGSSVILDNNELFAGSILRYPIIEIYCEECDDKRFFNPGTSSDTISIYSMNNLFVKYVCRNCGEYSKTYSFSIIYDKSKRFYVYKYGELPDFGDPISTKLRNMIGDNIDLFKKGRKAEYSNLGLGAFTYYRRMVEKLTTRLADEIVKVCRNTNISQDIINKLEKAKSLRPYSDSIKAIQELMPDSLIINGHNPFKLLFDVLSKNIHNESDEKCLSLAKATRITLIELAKRMKELTDDTSQLNEAMKILNQDKSNLTKNP